MSRPPEGKSGDALGRTTEVEIDLLDPAEGIAPGQAAVIYDGTRVVGSATITSTSRVSTSDGSARVSTSNGRA